MMSKGLTLLDLHRPDSPSQCAIGRHDSEIEVSYRRSPLPSNDVHFGMEPVAVCVQAGMVLRKRMHLPHGQLCILNPIFSEMGPCVAGELFRHRPTFFRDCAALPTIDECVWMQFGHHDLPSTNRVIKVLTQVHNS